MRANRDINYRWLRTEEPTYFRYGIYCEIIDEMGSVKVGPLRRVAVQCRLVMRVVNTYFVTM